MSNLIINSTPITDTKEHSTLLNKISDLYNSLMEELSPKQQTKLKKLVHTVTQYERLINNVIQIGEGEQGRLYAIKAVAKHE